MESDIFYLKEKIRNGADYVVTQMFFDNQKYFSFVYSAHKSPLSYQLSKHKKGDKHVLAS